MWGVFRYQNKCHYKVLLKFRSNLGELMENYLRNWKKQEVENRAISELANLNKEDIKRKAKRYKKNSIILYLLLGLIGIAGLIALVIGWIYYFVKVQENAFVWTLCFAIFVFLIFFTFGKIFIISRKSEEDLALSQIKIEVRKSISGLSNEQIINSMANGNFILSKSITINASGWSKTNLLVDNEHKLFIYQRGEAYSQVYHFADLINYEVYENGQSKVKGRAGSALIGGAFFGITGLIVGSSMSRQIEDKCNQLKLIIRLNDLDCPQIVITYVDNATWEKEGFTYRSMKENLQLVCSALEYIMNAKTLEQSAIEKTEEQITKEEKSLKEQIQELKEMLDDGLITQEEFEQKKKQILELKN